MKVIEFVVMNFDRVAISCILVATFITLMAIYIVTAPPENNKDK